MAHPLIPNVEQQMTRSLTLLIRDVYEAGNRDASQRLPQMAYRIATNAVERGSETLLRQACDLWYWQVALATEIEDEATRARIRELVPEMSYYVIASLTSRMEDDYRPLHERVDPVRLLRHLARFETRVQKLFLDLGDVDGFNAARARWSGAWFRHWTPEFEVEQLEQDLQFPRATDERDLRVDLNAARTVRDARDQAADTRAQYLLQLGAWLALNVGRDRGDPQVFARVVAPLAPPFSTSERIVRELRATDAESYDTSLVDDWETSQWVGSGVRTGYLPGRDAIRFWLTVLLARVAEHESALHDERDGLPKHLADTLRTHIARLARIVQ